MKWRMLHAGMPGPLRFFFANTERAWHPDNPAFGVCAIPTPSSNPDIVDSVTGRLRGDRPFDQEHEMSHTANRRLGWRLRALALLGLVLVPSPALHAADPPAAPVVPPRQGTSERIVLFDGNDLKGWKGHEKYWSVRNGAIVGKNEDPVKVSTYLLTDRDYSDFRLTATVKLVTSEMHSGIAFWGRIAPEQGDEYTYAGHLVMFPSGWGVYDLYGRKLLPVDPAPAKKVGKQHDWNELEILAQGNRVRVAVNGAQVVDWRDPEPDRIKVAPIGLQLHSNKVPQEVHFKDLVLETFPKEDRLITVK